MTVSRSRPASQPLPVVAASDSVMLGGWGCHFTSCNAESGDTTSDKQQQAQQSAGGHLRGSGTPSADAGGDAGGAAADAGTADGTTGADGVELPDPLPYLYLLVAHRNRAGNLARLVESLEQSLSASPAIRACTCVVVIDYATSLHATTPSSPPPAPLPPAAPSGPSGPGGSTEFDFPDISYTEGDVIPPLAVSAAHLLFPAEWQPALEQAAEWPRLTATAVAPEAMQSSEETQAQAQAHAQAQAQQPVDLRPSAAPTPTALPAGAIPGLNNADRAIFAVAESARLALDSAIIRAASKPGRKWRKRRSFLPPAIPSDPNTLTGMARYADRLRSDFLLRLLLGRIDGVPVPAASLSSAQGDSEAFSSLLQSAADAAAAQWVSASAGLVDIPQAHTGGAVLLDGTTFSTVGGWSKAALLQGAVEAAAAHTGTNSSVVMVLDADLVTRPGLWHSLMNHTRLAKSAFVPVVWSTCHNSTPETLPGSAAEEDGPNGYWRRAGTGMVAAFIHDVLAVGGYTATYTTKNTWGGEDIDFSARLSDHVRLQRPRMASLVHLYHTRVEWSNSADGIHMSANHSALLGSTNVCVKQGTCTCPPGSTLEEMVLQAATEAVHAAQVAQAMRDPVAAKPFIEQAHAKLQRYQVLSTYLNHQQRQNLEAG